MSQGTTVEAVRLALGMLDAQARVASRNIAQAGQPDAQAMRIDFDGARSLLASVLEGSAPASRLDDVRHMVEQSAPSATGGPIQQDLEVTDMVATSLHYQTLTEALSRHFGLMRLSISGRA